MYKKCLTFINYMLFDLILFQAIQIIISKNENCGTCIDYSTLILAVFFFNCKDHWCMQETNHELCMCKNMHNYPQDQSVLGCDPNRPLEMQRLTGFVTNRALNVFLLHGMELLQLAQNENKVTLAAVHQLITIVFQFISISTSLSSY